MKPAEEAEVIAKYAFESERKLRMTAKVGLAFPTIKERIVREFVQSVIAHLKPRLGKSWDVEDGWSVATLKSSSYIAVYKPTWAMDGGIGLHCSKTGPSDLNFFIYLSKKHKTPAAAKLGEALNERYAHGGHSGNNPWWKYVDPPYRDWNTEDALIGLWKKHADRGIRCSQRGVPASVLVGSSTSGQSQNLGRVMPRASPEFHQRQTLHWA